MPYQSREVKSVSFYISNDQADPESMLVITLNDDSLLEIPLSVPVGVYVKGEVVSKTGEVDTTKRVRFVVGSLGMLSNIELRSET